MEFNNLLKQENYSLVLPRTTIKPLDLIVRRNKNFFEWISFKTEEGTLLNAKLKDLFIQKGRSNYPKIKQGALPEKIKGSDIIDAKSNFAANFFQILQAKAEINKIEKVVFSFQETKELSANIIQIDDYINFAELNSKISYADELKKGNVFVIFSVLTSPKLSLRTANDFTWQGDLSSEKINEYIGKLEASNSYDNKEDYKIESENTEPLTFAIKTAKITYNKGKFRLTNSQIKVRKSGQIEGVELNDEAEINM